MSLKVTIMCICNVLVIAVAVFFGIQKLKKYKGNVFISKIGKKLALFALIGYAICLTMFVVFLILTTIYADRMPHETVFTLETISYVSLLIYGVIEMVSKSVNENNKK